MRTIALSLLLLPSVVRADPPWTPTAEQTAVYKALSIRDPAPTCEEVEALSADPVATLRVVVERAELPPWAPLRAAHCMVTRHASAAEADIVAWMGDPQTRGLALLTLGALDTLPEETARTVAAAALAGPHAADAREKIQDAGLSPATEAAPAATP